MKIYALRAHKGSRDMHLLLPTQKKLANKVESRCRDALTHTGEIGDGGVEEVNFITHL